MQEKHNTKMPMLLFAMGLLLVIGATFIVLLQKDDSYLIKLKGDGNTRVITKDIRVGPVPFFFWGTLFLYGWLASRISRLPLRSIAAEIILMGIIVHQTLLLAQLELLYPSAGAYSSSIYYWYMRAIFLAALFVLGTYCATWLKQAKGRMWRVDPKSIVIKAPYCFLFAALVILSIPRWPWISIGIAGLAFGMMLSFVRRNTSISGMKTLRILAQRRVFLTLCFLIVFFAVTTFAFRLITMYGQEYPSAGDDDWSLPAESFAKDMLHPETWNRDIALGYIIFLGLIYKTAGVNFYVVGVVQALIAACSVLLLYGIGKRLFDDQIGMIAAALLALNGPFLNIFSTLSTEGPYTFTILLMLWSLLRYKGQLGTSAGKRWLILAAVSFTSAELIKPQTLFFIVPLFLWLWFIKKRQERKQQWKAIALFLLATILFMTPFAVYDVLVNGQFTIISAGGARAFTNAMGRELNKAGVNPYQLGIRGYVEKIVKEPGEVMGIFNSFIPKFFLRFLFSDWFGAFDLILIHRHTLFADQLRFYAYVAILIGAYLTWRTGKCEPKRQVPGCERAAWKDRLFVFSFIPYTTVIILLASSSKVRYRLPLDPLFLLLIAVTLAWLWNAGKHFWNVKNRRSETAA